ncbi:MAG: hypothetical protein NC212_07655 [Staphylococcus sp.]|nr:hypothetical protein [Staphylococcus sp.]
MSKVTLRKALRDFEAPELRNLLLDVYSKSKEAKEILDFFAEPDITAKTEEYKAILTKEARRYTRRAYRPRLPRLRATVRRFAILEPGDEAVGELMIHVCLTLISLGATEALRDQLYDNIAKYLDDTVKFLADRQLLADNLPRLRRASESISQLGRFGHMRNPLSKIVGQALTTAENLLEKTT